MKELNDKNFNYKWELAQINSDKEEKDGLLKSMKEEMDDKQRIHSEKEEALEQKIHQLDKSILNL